MLVGSDREKIAYAQGFEAGWEYKLGSKIKVENPFDIMKEFDYYDAWQKGFEAAEDGLI